MTDRLPVIIESSSISRRDFLSFSSRLAAAVSLGGMPGRRGDRLFRGREYPFTLGIASGDPLPDGVVLWTRLAPDPLVGGGMAPERVSVRWEVAADESFQRIVRTGSTVATPDLAHSVHVDVRGLESGRPYWYRFVTGEHESPVGRTFTAPPAGSDPAQLRFAFASCQNYEAGLYTAWQHMAEEDLQLVVHLGDYIYEGGVGRNGVRQHNGPETVTLEAYRNRYALYKSDPSLQAAHAAFPFIVTWDDHEVANNYAGPNVVRMTMDEFLLRRAAGYQAYYENMPLREAAIPRGADMQLYRRLKYGRLAEFNVLDTRQYRSLQPCGGHVGSGWLPGCADARDPSQTILGHEQRDWLHDGLRGSPARWNVLAHQVPMAPYEYPREDGSQDPSMEKWAGYAFERDQLMRLFHEAPIRNPISIVGDVHQNWLADLKADYNRDDSPVVGTEFVGTSITSGGDGVDYADNREPWMPANPLVRFANGQRGYVRCTLTPERWVTDFRVIPFVSRAGAPVATRASFVVEDRRPIAVPV